SVRDALSYLRELGVDIELRNHAGLTPLARALREGTGVEVQVLCELGADVNATAPIAVCSDDECATSESPLVFAAIAAAVEPAEKLSSLLAAGVKLRVTDSRRRTPVEFARLHLDEVNGYEPSAFKDQLVEGTRHCVELLDGRCSPGKRLIDGICETPRPPHRALEEPASRQDKVETFRQRRLCAADLRHSGTVKVRSCFSRFMGCDYNSSMAANACPMCRLT